MPGSLPIDDWVIYKQIYPRAEVGQSSSLAFYLNLCGLPGKEDMPVNCMWHIYAADNPKGLCEVAWYCITDVERSQALMVCQNVVNECCKVALLSYVSLGDTFSYAGGEGTRYVTCWQLMHRSRSCSALCGVERTLLLDNARQMGDTEAIESVLRQYSPSRPIIALDFASLYPLAHYNL